MKNIKIILNGASGKMGQEIMTLVQEHKNIQIFINSKKHTLPGIQNIKTHKNDRLVVIDFSSPKGFDLALSYAIKNKIPFVSGTTGLSAKDYRKINLAGLKIPILWSPNMSRGVNLFYNIVDQMGSTFKEMDIRIEESHHIRKKDRPSGTALHLLSLVEKTTHKKLPPINVIRAGGIIGQHKLHLVGEEEILTIEHSAWSRKVFARGAVDVANWIVNKRAKVYTMKDFIQNGKK